MIRLPSLMRHALALSLAAGMAVPAAAAPAFVANAPVASANVVDVQYRRGERRDQRRPDRFERRGNSAYWRGHRGYRQARPGYRQYNGWWFPSAAFIAGAIIGGGATAAPPPRAGSRHVAWCHERWRSYRASDNTYQPYNGPRRQCVSPYS